MTREEWLKLSAILGAGMMLPKGLMADADRRGDHGE
jgi:hypothetical protein